MKSRGYVSYLFILSSVPLDLLLLEFWVFFDWTDVDNSTLFVISEPSETNIEQKLIKIILLTV